MPENSPDRQLYGTVTGLLQDVQRGDEQARSRLMEIVYPELRRIAGRYMAGERGNHTLQPTALVNEAYLRIIEQHNISWEGRAHFLAVSAQVMRHILVDSARVRRAAKRGGAWQKVTLDDGVAGDRSPLDLIEIDEALARLGAIDARQSRIVEMRFFGGLSLEEIARVLGISERTVKRDWSMARAWLYGELTAKPPRRPVA